MIKLLDFYMDTCAPCKQIKPTLEEIAQTTEVEFVNAKENQELSVKYGVRRVPTLIFLKDDEEVHRTTGLVSRKQIDDIIESLS